MKIAYVIDGSTELSPSIKKKQDIYSLLFKGYNPSGSLVNIKDKKHLDVLQDLTQKEYLEPTPGMYRDLYQKLQKEGYDYIVCIPQSKQKSKSYKFASYASKFYDEFVLVVDADEYNMETVDILKNLLNVNDIKDNSILILETFEQLIEVVRNILVKVNLVTA